MAKAKADMMYKSAWWEGWTTGAFGRFPHNPYAEGTANSKNWEEGLLTSFKWIASGFSLETTRND